MLKRIYHLSLEKNIGYAYTCILIIYFKWNKCYINDVQKNLTVTNNHDRYDKTAKEPQLFPT